MRQTVSDFGQVFLVYCIDRLSEDGTYVALNRRYLPVGVCGGTLLEAQKLPVRLKFKVALSKTEIAALSCYGDAKAERIYLYADDSVPTASAEAWAAYAERLSWLSSRLVIH